MYIAQFDQMYIWLNDYKKSYKYISGVYVC